MWNKITAISSISWTVSRSTLASYHRCCQRNRRWVLTTGSDGRTLLRTVVNTCFMTTVPFCWRGLTPGPTGGRINIKWTYFFIWKENIYHAAGASGEDLNAATAMPTSSQCPVVTVGLSCLVFEIWPPDGQQTYRRWQSTHIWPLRRTSNKIIQVRQQDAYAANAWCSYNYVQHRRSLFKGNISVADCMCLYSLLWTVEINGSVQCMWCIKLSNLGENCQTLPEITCRQHLDGMRLIVSTVDALYICCCKNTQKCNIFLLITDSPRGLYT